MALAGASALTACGGGGDGASAPGTTATGTTTPSASAPGATASAGPSAGAATGTAPSAPADGVEGSWVAMSGDQAVALVVTGDNAAVFAAGGALCSGIAGQDSGTRTLRLKCSDDSTERASGRVVSVDRTSLKVAWDGGLGTETYLRSEGAAVPFGLPTAGPGS